MNFELSEAITDIELVKDLIDSKDCYMSHIMDTRARKTMNPSVRGKTIEYQQGKKMEYNRSLSQGNARRLLPASYFSLESLLLLICLTASLLILPLILPPLPPPPFLLLLLPIGSLLVLMILAFMPSNVRDITSTCVEKVVVPMTKPYITFQGAGKDVTVMEWHDRASDPGPNGQQLHTYRTASVTVFANYFSARNISFKNTAPAPMPGMQGWQAAAFRISGDKAYFSGCGFYGAQDTLCDDAGRHYFKECYIEGSIDFIFGNGRSMYKDCELHSIATRSEAAHARKLPYEKTGFAFVRCRVMGTGPLYVGRAMGQYSRIVYAYTY